jgi:tetratricopeptide (TPR) repeat protein
MKFRLLLLVLVFVCLPCPAETNDSASTPASAPAATASSPVGGATTPAPPQTKENETYVTLARQVDDTAKLAILSAQNNLDVAKWIVIVFAALVSAAAAAGYKSINDQAKQLDEMFKQRLDLMAERYEAEAKKSIDETKEKMLAATKKISNATLVAFFINAARSRSNQINQLGKKIEDGTADDSEKVEFYDLVKFTKRSFQSALKYIDEADDEMIGIMSTGYTDKRRVGVPNRIVMTGDIYTTLGWLAKRQKSYSEALDYGKKVEAMDPDHDRATLNIACYYSLSGDIENGFEYLEKALAKDPSKRDAARIDPDLATLRAADNARFDHLVGLANP